MESQKNSINKSSKIFDFSTPFARDSMEEQNFTSYFQQCLKYTFVFITNLNSRKSNKSSCTMDIDYLMSEAYELISKIEPYVANDEDYSVEIHKKWLEAKRLESFMSEIKNARDDCNLTSSSGDLNIELDGSRTPEIINFEPINRYIFVISSFGGEVFDCLCKNKRRIIGPLTIQYWYRFCCGEYNNLDCNLVKRISNFHDCLFSECMRDTMIYLSKSIPSDELFQLYNRIRFMGGCVTDRFDLDVTHAVTETQSGSGDSQSAMNYFSSDKCINAAASFEIPVVNADWINIAWSHLQLQYKFASDKNFVCHQLNLRLQVESKPLLKSFTIGILDSVYSNHKSIESKKKFDQIKIQLNNVIVRYGGSVIFDLESLNRNKMNLILHINKPITILGKKNDYILHNDNDVIELYEMDAEYHRLNEKRSDDPIPIVKIDWLLTTITRCELQPFEPYLIRRSMEKHPTPRSLDKSKSYSSDIDAISWLDNSQ
ncbi:hypothetical protein SSS_01763 [Sarcoptes scabiei]|uniref:BRCT-domain containing protein n=1 Tax=Sarcoptes scabiei TaxID=52283 RepID=A0A132A338_SARSC|nr:hypothetical protein SSS_01763 [Sarcoptes scabiei]KPM05373.1 BRCT-domain containing protein [Sarcoptes scabiei]